MKFNFKNYNLFCYDFRLKPCRYKNLEYFKKYCEGQFDIVFKIERDY